jgi:hypothetical protein
MYLNEYVKTVAYLKAQHGVGTELGLAHMQPHAALKMCVTLARHVPVTSGQVARARATADSRSGVLLALTKGDLVQRLPTTRRKCNVPVAHAMRGAL